MLTFHVLGNAAIPTNDADQFDARTTFIIRFYEVFIAKGHIIQLKFIECHEHVRSLVDIDIL